MERAAILETINAIMIDCGKAINRNVKPAEEISSENGIHTIKYDIKLSSGIATINLVVRNNALDPGYSDKYSSKNPADYKEIADAFEHFERSMDTGKINELLGSLK